MHLTKTQKQIYDLVKQRPRTPRELIEAIHWQHPQDMPDIFVIKAHIWHLNQKLRSQGVCIRGSWGGDTKDRGSVYELRKLDGDSISKPAESSDVGGLERD